LEPILHLLEQKRGAVVVSAHIGPMEHMIQAISAFGYPLIGIAEHMKSEPLHRYIMGLRTAHGLDLISTKGSLLDVLRRVKQGEVLASAIDRDSTETGRILDFFGEPAWLPDGYARVAVGVNVPVVFACCRRAGNGTVAKVFEPIYPDRSLGKEQAVADVLARAVGQLEEAIREDPAEWHLSTPVWRVAQERLEQARLP
jgi:KDO2-lipid IV(A) lauroyltransferase